MVDVRVLCNESNFVVSCLVYELGLRCVSRGASLSLIVIEKRGRLSCMELSF